MTENPTPELLSVSQCDKSLEFLNRSHWPAGLPGFAIQKWIVAGFDRDLVLNHSLDLNDSESIARLISSLYSQISFTEAVLFAEKARNFSWIPLDALMQSWGFRWSEPHQQVAEKIQALGKDLKMQSPSEELKNLNLSENLKMHSPSEDLKTQSLGKDFQIWLIEKRVGPQDLLILNSIKVEQLPALLAKILALKCSRQQGVQALELGSELLLMKIDFGAILAQAKTAEDLVQSLKKLRFPQTTERDQASEQKWQQLPWPGQSQVRWVRQGDRAGLELRLFFGAPSDLKKSVLSLQKIQDLLEQNQEATWLEH